MFFTERRSTIPGPSFGAFSPLATWSPDRVVDPACDGVRSKVLLVSVLLAG